MTLPEPRTILLAQAGASCAMAGLIWFVQLVHYPAYRFVGEGDFRRYQTHHQRSTSWVVGPPMLVELSAAVALVIWPVADFHAGWAWGGLGLLGLVWASTAFCQMPLHATLLASGAAAEVERLVHSNWVRTIGWSMRAALSLAMLQWVA